MVKQNTSISIDHIVKRKSVEVLKQKGVKLSFYIERVLRNLLEQEGIKLDEEEK